MLGILFFAGWSLNNNFPLPSMLPAFESDTPLQVPTKLTPVSGAVSVTNQPAGPQVTIESVTVPPPGVWIAVREVVGNDLGNVLGAVRVTGPRSSVSIPLLRATQPGSSYAIELYRDGGNDVFDLSTDSVYVDFTTGAPVIAYFTTHS